MREGSSASGTDSKWAHAVQWVSAHTAYDSLAAWLMFLPEVLVLVLLLQCRFLLLLLLVVSEVADRHTRALP